VRALEALPFVARLDVVRRYRRGPAEKVTDLPAPARASSAVERPRALVLDYGTSIGQLRQIGVPDVHAAGLHGEGVIIAVLDAGFNNLAHEVFAPLTILARRDFVNGDEDVADGSDRGEGSHGTMTLSVLGGFKARPLSEWRSGDSHALTMRAGRPGRSRPAAVIASSAAGDPS